MVRKKQRLLERMVFKCNEKSLPRQEVESPFLNLHNNKFFLLLFCDLKFSHEKYIQSLRSHVRT